MKLFKHSYSYGAKQSSFSKYEHQQHMSQPNYARDSKPCYDGLARDYVLGQSMGSFDANESNHARLDNSINYNAQAQSALSSPSIRVKQGHHVMEGMNKHESHIGHEWASNSPKFSNPAQVNESRLEMHKDKHKMGEMEHGWGTKPNQYSNHHFGESGYQRREQKAYSSGEGGIEGGYNNKSTVFSSPNYLKPIKTSQPSIIERKEDHSWANSTSNFTSPSHGDRNSRSNFSCPSHGQHNSTSNFSTPIHGQRNSTSNFSSMTHNQRHSASNFSSPTHDQGNSIYTFSSPTHGQHPSLAMDKEGPLMEKMDHGWANSTSRFSIPTHVQHSSLGMQKDDHSKGRMDLGWANSPTKLSSSTPTHQSAQTTYNNEHTMHKRDHGWAYSPNRFSDSTQTHQTILDEMGRHGRDNSPSKLSSPTKAHHSNLEMHEEDNLTGNMNRGWANSPTKHYGPNNLYNSNHTHNTQHRWDQKSSNGFWPIQANHPSHTSYHEYDQHVDDDVHDIMDEILSKYPDHNVGSGPGRSGWAAKPSSYTGPNEVGGYAKKQAFWRLSPIWRCNPIQE